MNNPNKEKIYFVSVVTTILIIFAIGLNFYWEKQRIANEIALIEKTTFTDEEREFYYEKATEPIGGAGEFRKLSEDPSSTRLTLIFSNNYQNMIREGDKIIVEDTFIYMNNSNKPEYFKFRNVLSKDGEYLEGQTMHGTTNKKASD